MKITDFTEHPEVKAILDQLRTDGIDQKVFSDVLDADNHQYIELVQEGGGVLGVALIGYTYVLEQMGLRFFSLAGTSAGSINALLIASFGDIAGQKSEKLIKVLSNKDLYDFVDGDRDARDFIEALVEKAKRFKLVWKGMQVIDNLTDDLGLNPGDDFLNWLSGILADNGISTTQGLIDAFRVKSSQLKIREGIDRTAEDLTPRFAVITSDLTTETKVEFPRMRELYWKEHDKVNPALFVRASMSIPYFFKPLIVKNLPSGEEAKARWDSMARFQGEVPPEAYFVDGGIMSNFPIDLFHKFNSVPRMPTFGVRLGIDRNESNKISSPVNLFGAMFNSIRHLHDYDFILRNPDYKHLIQHINIGHHNWLNFALTDDDKKDLFARGAMAADRFLRKFDWNGYKEIRRKMINQLTV
jgi:NTE family protein